MPPLRFAVVGSDERAGVFDGSVLWRNRRPRDGWSGGVGVRFRPAFPDAGPWRVGPAHGTLTA
mgnify:CR=1 FL=1